MQLNLTKLELLAAMHDMYKKYISEEVGHKRASTNFVMLSDFGCGVGGLSESIIKKIVTKIFFQILLNND